MPEFLITEISVEAQHKTWMQGAGIRGDSGGTIFSWTVKPPPGTEGWTTEEASEVAVKVRRKLQGLLVMDARARNAPDPDGGDVSLKNYDVALSSLSNKDRQPSSED